MYLKIVPYKRHIKEQGIKELTCGIVNIITYYLKSYHLEEAVDLFCIILK